MATTFYYDPIAVPTISPDFSTSWEQTSAAVRRCLSTTKHSNGSAEITFADAETSAVNNFDVLLVQAISPPLAAQTISGAISGQIRCSETDALANMSSHVIVRAFSGDGLTERGVLLDAVNITEFVLTTLTNRRCPTSTAPTSTAVLEGDVLVVEVGYRAANTAVTSWSGTISLGRGASGDLPVDITTTTADNPWIAFADNLAFMPESIHPENSRAQFAEAIEQGTGTANAALTVTLPASAGRRHAISAIEIKRTCGAAGVAGTATLSVSTLNLQDMNWLIGNAIAAGGTRKDVDIGFYSNRLLSDKPGTPTVFAFPAPGANTLWSVRVAYSLVP